MHYEMSRVQRFLNQNKQLHKIAQTVELFTDKFLVSCRPFVKQDRAVTREHSFRILAWSL